MELVLGAMTERQPSIDTQLVNGGLVPSLVREAMRRANEERPGDYFV